MTTGLSPKALIPAIALALTGALVILAGVAIGDGTVVTVGVALIGAVGVQLPAAIRAQPGNVRPPELYELGNDEHPGIKSAAAGPKQP